MFKALLFIFCHFLFENEAHHEHGNEVRNRALFSFAASLRYDQRHYCNGALIGQKAVLTTYHCIHGFTDDMSSIHRLSIALGHLRLNEITEHFLTYQATNIRLHPEFDKYPDSPRQHDIAVVETRQTIEYNIHTRPAAIAVLQHEYPNICTIVGWGTKKMHQKGYTDKLLYSKLVIWTNEDCEKHLELLNKNMKNLHCATGDGIHECAEDDGSAIVCGKYVVGIVTVALCSGTNDETTTFVEVYPHAKWIRNQHDDDDDESEDGRKSIATIQMPCFFVTTLFLFITRLL